MSDKIKEAKKQIELREKAKETQKTKEKFEKFKQNGITITKESGFDIEERVRLKEIVTPEFINKHLTKIAHTSDYKRLIYLSITGETWRGTNAKLEKNLAKMLKELQNK